MLGSLDNSFPDIQKALDDYSVVLKSGNADIVNTRQYVQQIRDGLRNVISDLIICQTMSSLMRL